MFHRTLGWIPGVFSESSSKVSQYVGEVVLSQVRNPVSVLLFVLPGRRHGPSPFEEEVVPGKPGTPAFWYVNQPHGSIAEPRGSATSVRKNGQAWVPPEALNVTQPFDAANTAAGQYVLSLIMVAPMRFSGVLL
jgi:hypothetical protein